MIKNLALIFILLSTLIVESQEVKYSIKNLKINNNYSNFGTTYFGEEQVVYASPRKHSYIIKNVWKGNNQPFLDLFIGDIAEDGELINVKPFSKVINTRYHEADVAFTKDHKTVYFSRNNYLNNKYTKDSTGVNLIQLYRARISSSGEWEQIEPMPFNNDHYQTGHPTLSKDERTLYFISDMPGGYGKTDVYKASIGLDGSIGVPINLGPVINTAEREMFSFISGDDELYFSSDGRKEGLGGLDIYVSKITENGVSEPQNLGKPINSDKDDFSFILNYESRRGYFSSNRAGGKGDDDIYTFVQDIPLEFECNQLVKGTVVEKKSGNLLPNSEVILQDESGKEIGKIVTGEKAEFSFEIPCNQSYKLIGSKENYSTDLAEFFSTEGKELIIPLQLVSQEFTLERGKCLVKINPIYFNFDKSDIRPDAALELDKVVAVMNKYPELIIEGGSHTDSRGTFSYNEALSTRRAISTVEYIISKGINPNRITARGYGETLLVNNCADGVNCSEKEHQFNRRTEFVIVNFEEIKNRYPEICSVNAVSTNEQLENNLDLNLNRQLESFNSLFEKEGSKVLIKINPIYYDLNSSYLKAEALKELFKVIEVMKKYPNLLIECGSHTDSRASNEYNKWLSDRRAKRITDYIISKGISPNRITSKGYGETQPANHCSNGVKCLEFEHLKNRRTEFVVLNPEIITIKNPD